MKYAVPVNVVIEVASPAEALQATQKLDELLNQSIVRFTLRGKGVELVGFKIGEAKPTW
jgi:hypothetical protein